MITFCIALLLLVAGYFVYGALVEKVFGVNPGRQTPAYTSTDGIDYIPMPTWKVFLIQFLNIAGLGPIFGAIMGILYGPSAYLWIVFGTIFGGAVHDYLSGMLSVRRNGASLPELVGDELGSGVKQVMRIFSLLLMILVGAVFVVNPANLLDLLTGENTTTTMWIAIIFGYYILATLLPIDKLIGRLYPLFGFALLFMAIGIMISLFLRPDSLPEFHEAIGYTRPDSDVNPIFPMMFISIACGAISGFHATQSPMMARCLKNEKMGRRVFYGAMVVEGIVALIWAAAAIAFFNGSFDALSEFLKGKTPAILVNDISVGWLGTFGGILAMLGVIAAPITSGDTALRSARLIAADFLHIPQKKIRNRLLVSIPIFILAWLVMMIDFEVLWSLPEFHEAIGYTRPDSDVNPIFPMMFISIACGAISGFHATQSPMMARCLKNEKMGRRVFYGAMVVEGIVALIWAAAAIAFFNGSFDALSEFLKGKTPAILVNDISVGWLGTFGGILAMLGVIAAPITSGDTALRSARLIAADFLHIPQKKIRNRLLVSIPIFILAWLVMMIDFEVLWRYFAWCNQTLAVFTLWALTVWLAKEHKCYWLTLIPALFMTMVTVTYIFFAQEGFRLSYSVSLGIAVFVTLLLSFLFIRFLRTLSKRGAIKK